MLVYSRAWSRKGRTGTTMFYVVRGVSGTGLELESKRLT